MLLTEKLLIAKIKQRVGGRLRFAVSGAAALAPEVGEFIDALGIVVLEGYGLTETSAGGTGSTPELRRIGSVGKALPGVRIDIDKTATGAGPNDGEIILHHRAAMRGYHNLPEQTKASLTADGGLRTGDLGYVDNDGYLFITGRVKELYKLSNGKYVAPTALEEKLQLSPYIAQSFVYGSDHPHNTAVIIADMPSVEAYCTRHGVRSQAPANDLLQLPQVRELFRDGIDRYSHKSAAALVSPSSSDPNASAPSGTDSPPDARRNPDSASPRWSTASSMRCSALAGTVCVRCVRSFPTATR